MKIPPEIFQELISSGSFASTPSGSELRSVPRFVASLAVLLIRLNGDKNAKPLPATVKDISTRGVGLEFSEPIHVSDPFAIRLPLRNGSFLWLHCVSMRWAPISGKVCSIGAKFTGLFAPPKAGTGVVAVGATVDR